MENMIYITQQRKRGLIMKRFISFALLVFILAFSSSSVYAAQPKPTKDEIKTTLQYAVNSQYALDFEHTYETTVNLLKPWFTDSFIKNFMNKRVKSYVNENGVRIYHVPGSDNLNLYATGFSWGKNTKITYSKDGKSIVVSERFPGGYDEAEGDYVKAHTMSITLVKSGFWYKINSISYKS